MALVGCLQPTLSDRAEASFSSFQEEPTFYSYSWLCVRIFLSAKECRPSCIKYARVKTEKTYQAKPRETSRNRIVLAFESSLNTKRKAFSPPTPSVQHRHFCSASATADCRSHGDPSEADRRGIVTHATSRLRAGPAHAHSPATINWPSMSVRTPMLGRRSTHK